MPYRSPLADELDRRFGSFCDELEVRLKKRLADAPHLRGASNIKLFLDNVEASGTDDALRAWLWELAPVDDAKLVFLGFWKLVVSVGADDAESLAIAERVLGTISLRVACREFVMCWVKSGATDRSP